jgi:branched-chain amino acid transport system substrate-binding protein
MSISSRARSRSLIVRVGTRRGAQSALVVVGAALAVAACGSDSGSGGASESGGSSPKTGTVTFWSSNGLTGGSAFYGKGSLEAQQLLQKQINDAGGIKTNCGQTYKIALKTWDDANTPAQAVAGMQKAAPDKSILGMIASTSDTAWLPEVPVAGQVKLPMIIPSDGSTVPADKWNEWAFRVFGSEEVTFQLSIKALQNAVQMKRIAVIYDNTNQSQSGDAELWKKNAASIGAQVVAYESFSPDAKNFQAQLTKAQAQNPDFLVLDGQEPSGLYNQAKQLGMIPKIPAYSFAGINNTEQEWKLTNGAVKGSYDFSPTAIGPNVDLHDKDAVQLYKDKAGVYPNTFQLAGWDALALAADAVKRSCTNSDRQKFRDALAQTKDFPLSTQGTVTWKNPPTGENVSPSAIVTQVTGPGTFNVVK